MAKNTSLSNRCNCKTKSALDKNLNAKANSKNPNTTFTVFNQPPDLGKVFTMVYMITGFGIMLNFLNAFYENRQEKQKQIQDKIAVKKSRLSNNA